MTMFDPIADMLTRIRNANTAKHDTVDVPASKMKLAIAEILFEEGYIKKFEVIEDGLFKTIRITLKYGADKNEKIISGIKRISAIEIFILEAGTSTVSCFAVFALRILVSISAIGSLVIILVLPPYQLAFFTPGICPL